MNHIYLSLSVVLFCVFLAYFIFSKLLILTVFCVVLVGFHFKDDFNLYRYVATHVASFYLWICGTYTIVLNMYNQSNSTNFPIRKCLHNNGTVRPTNKLDNIQRTKPNVAHNLNSSLSFEIQSVSYGNSTWNSTPTTPPKPNYFPNRLQSRQDTPTLYLSNKHIREENKGYGVNSTKTISPLNVSTTPTRLTYSESPLDTIINRSNMDTSSGLNSPILDARLYANVNSPGFCSRVAERLSESMTHQPKYNTVGAFPVVNLNSQSPKIKIKTPVRVRLAPPSNDILFTSTSTNSVARSPLIGPDESMKSVLQVLKDISRKRIHSHVDEDIEENTKRLRVSESQFDSDSVLQTSLLQQTIQGKRAREESSPTEDDVKKKRKPLQNNEILSSLSSSISIKAPHLTKKRKAQAIDDSVSTTPVLGKLLKVQTEVTPPPSTIRPASPGPSTSSTPPSTSQEFVSKKKETPTSKSSVVEERERASEREEEEVVCAASTITDPDEGAVSRLLGRMSGQTSHSTTQPLTIKNNVFMSTNDLSLSPPKENRLAAMIAVLGGPSENIQHDTSPIEDGKSERQIKGKALFTSPETPEVLKQSKKVTFSESLTTTKMYDLESTQTESTSSGTSVVIHATPLTSLTDGVPSSPTPTDQKLYFGSPILNTSQFALSASCETKEPITLLKSATDSVSSSIPPSTHAMTSKPLMFSSLTSNTTSPLNTSIKGLESQTLVPTVSNSSGLRNNDSPKPVFSFGSRNVLVQRSKADNPTLSSNSDLIPNKNFSFGNNSDTTQVAPSNSELNSLPANSLNQNVTSKSEMSSAADATGQNKLTFSFGNKDTGVSSPFGKSEEVDKQLVNGLTSANSVSPFVVPLNFTSKQQFPSQSMSSNNTQPAPTFAFGSNSPFTSNPTAKSDPQPLSTVSNTLGTITSPIRPSPNQSAQSITSFGTTLSNSPQISKSSPLGSIPQMPSHQNTQIFISPTSLNGDSFKIMPSIAPTQVQSQSSVFGNAITQAAGFGAVAAPKSDGEIKLTTTVHQNIATNQSNNLFGNLSSNTTSKPSIFGAIPSISSVHSNPNPNPIFGLPAVTASSQASSSPFGIPVNSSAPQPKVAFGNLSTTTPTTGFATLASNTVSVNNTPFLNPSTTTGGSSSLFNSSSGSQLSKPMFVNSSAAPPSFGEPNKNSTPTFGNLNNTNTAAFGNQNNSVTTFGNQNNTSVSGFGNQNNSLNASHSGFGTSGISATSGTFSMGTSSSNTTEVKAPSFSSSSPFVFGSATSTKEPAKPFGAVSPFSFGSNAQPNATMASSTQPPQPTFGAPGTGFGTSQQLPAFGSSMTQAPTSAFSFSQTSAASGTAFQFSATGPPQPAGGMFSIGTGSSSSRSKTAFRRRHKPT
uniref:Uncharacterized protein n=1 Tax=Graphocephala atropunctata TaxID=36148 RepID=A0A1B6MJC4_9HEMI